MSGGFAEYVMAVDRVEQRLRRAAAALDAAGIAYALVGGNAVAAWVARVDPSATRATKDVDLLVNRSDLDAITAAMTAAGFVRDDLRGLTMFIDPAEPSRRSAVYLVWAGERVRPSHAVAAPTTAEAVRDPDGFALLGLASLVRMKLTSFRDVDRVHLRDLAELGLITEAVRAGLPDTLTERLEQIESPEDEP